MFLIVGCTTEPTSSDLTSVTEPEVITETITETVEVMKYQCSDGTVVDDLADCPPAVTEPDLPEATGSYDTNKHLINELQYGGEFSFTVTYAGFDGTDYRVDFEVKNLGSESEYFQPGAIAILDEGMNQYDVVSSFSYPVSTMSNTILPGVTKEGYWEFDDVPATGGEGIFTFELGWSNPDIFRFDVPLS